MRGFVKKDLKTFIVLIVLALSCSVSATAQQFYQFNKAGTSHLYWPFPNSNWTTQNGWKIGGCGYGCDKHMDGDYYAQDWVFNDGTCDASFLSPIEGSVLYRYKGTDDNLGYGNEICIQSYTGEFVFRISHLSDVKSFSEGQHISVGDTIGTVGQTGGQTECHAHTVLYKNMLESTDANSFRTGIDQLKIFPHGTPELKYSAEFGFDAVCTQPQNVNITNITNNSATISWNFVAGAQEYKVTWADPYYNFGVFFLEETTINLQNITPNTSINVTVNALCYGGFEGGITASQFTTGCSSPSGISHSKKDEGVITVSWNSVAQATGYQVRYRQNNTDDPWTTSPVLTSTEVDVTGLQQIAYEMQVGSQCNGGITWSDVFTVDELAQVQNIPLELWVNNPISCCTATYEAVNLVTGTNSISGPSNITFKAGQEIVLGSGFAVAKDSRFYAYNGTSSAAARINSSYLDQLQNEESDNTFSISPNPFNRITTFQYRLEKENTPVSLFISNTQGKVIATLAEGDYQSAGQHQIKFDPKDLADGMYTYKMIIGTQLKTGKIVLVK